MTCRLKREDEERSVRRPYGSIPLWREKEKYVKKIVHAVLHGTVPLHWGMILIIVLAAVGLLPLLGSLRQESQMRNISSLRPGWQTIISYRGVGSATITGQHIPLPQVWGEGLWCQGDAVQIAISGVKTKMALGTSTCSASQSPVSPQSISLDLQPENIQTLTVTAAPSTMWQLDFLQEAKATAVQIGSGWSEAISIGGVSNPARAILGGIGTTPEKLWGIVGVCIGDTGASISAQFTPTPGKISSLACDGKPHLSLTRYASPTAVQEMQVTPSSGKHVVFSTALVACANESQCESNQPPIYPTPTSVLNAY